MDILQAASTLRPGTTWIARGDRMLSTTTLIQADDGAPTVAVPTPAELQAVLDAAANAPQPLSIEDRVANLESAVNQISLATNMPVSLPTTTTPIS